MVRLLVSFDAVLDPLCVYLHTSLSWFMVDRLGVSFAVVDIRPLHSHAVLFGVLSQGSSSPYRWFPNTFGARDTFESPIPARSERVNASRHAHRISTKPRA